MGIPINSAADDSHFRLAKDGYTGYLASARKDGLGRRDLYVAYFSQYRSEMDMAVRPSATQPATEGKQLPAGKKSYALSFMLQDAEKTLTDDQVDKAMGRIRQAFEKEVGAELRG